MLRVAIFKWAPSPERNVRGVITTSDLASMTATRWRACAGPRLDGDLLEPFDRLGRVSFLVLENRGGQELGVSGRLARRELGDERFPGGDRLVGFLLGHEAVADLKEDLGHPGIEGVLADEVGPGGAGFGMATAAGVIGGDQELSVEDGALGVGALGTVGKPRQIALPGRDGLGEFLLPLQDLADVKRSRHGQLGPVAAGRRRSRP